jgi:Archaeal fructose-1,6-bisphosphatase and related enzymes of inositol monophosphatase family
MNSILARAEKAVREAGMFFLNKNFDEGLVIKDGTANYATQIDLKVEKFLVEKLKEILPESNIITEESKNNKFNLDSPTWVLDPVDGTINIYHGYHQTAISLALFIDGKPAAGIVYNPEGGEMFTAEAGNGAYLNGSRISVSSRQSMEESLISFGTTPYYRDRVETNFNITKHVFSHCQDIRRSGSAALDIAYTACGRIDGFFEGILQPWDYAGAMTILREAGGEITNWEGTSPAILHPDSIIASNGLIHKQMTEIILNNRN